ncbi:right-handed parallel beta-helix repeat-containing protein [Streptomyces sp. NPDC049597]|uniref:right-handed parallel beta-helix repeat-containing protein n=1 Tax=Streptomyces sp. NPDC049597 TaxID=3155276 RepID=UPI00343B718E
MTKRQITCLASTALLVASGVAAAAPAHAAHIHHVSPGQSIQAAVNAARPGDTVVIAAGTYRESVQITTSGLTLRGAGARTVIKPAAATARAENACAAGGNGVCVTGTAQQSVDNVRIQGLALSGFAKSGLWASWTDRLTVRGVTSEKNGTWGIAEQRSTRSVLTGNIVRSNGDAGIFVANTVSEEAGATDTRGTRISGNVMTDNRIGATVRRVRNLTVDRNTMTANCAGLFLVGDESKPRAGALTVTGNHVLRNNKACKATARLPEIQGAGIVLTGTEDTVVERNIVWGNVGSSPFSGGIVLFKSVVGIPGTDNVVRDNVVVRNGAADLADRDSAGTGNRFDANVCGVSEPAGLC